MQQFNCSCGWTWIVGRRKVWGPIYDCTSASGATFPVYGGSMGMQPRGQWEETDADCAAAFIDGRDMEWLRARRSGQR